MIYNSTGTTQEDNYKKDELQIENIDYIKILKECNDIINNYNQQIFDSFKKNKKIYEQAKIIKFLIEEKKM